MKPNRLSEVERGLLDSLVWPDEDAVREALEPLAVDDLDRLRLLHPAVAAELDAAELEAEEG